MATLGKWTGGDIKPNLPTSTWAVPGTDIFPTEDRNDSSAYSLSSHVLTLPSSDLADGYLIIGAFQLSDTSNARVNPQGRFVYSGSGTAVSAQTTGYSRQNSENQSYVRTWAFVDAPTASDTFTFQWRIDSDNINSIDGSIQSELQIIPLFYAEAGIYSSASTTCTGGTTPTQVTGFTGTDGSNITISSDTITMAGDNKKYLCLGSYYWAGIGNDRTQRWGGFRIGGTKYDGAKGYSYGRDTNNADIGELFTHLLETSTADETVDMFVYRGDGILNGEGGAEVDGNTTGTSPNHVIVILELNDGAEGFNSENDTATGDLTNTSGTAMPVAEQLNFNDSASFTALSDTEVNCVVTGDYLFGADISAASNNVADTTRHTLYSEFTINGIANPDSRSGDYLRNDQSTTGTFGVSSNNLGFETLTAGDDIGVEYITLTGSESGGDPIAPAGWVGFWGINLDTLENTAPPAARNRIFITG